jgi:hypothetical protein
LSDGDRLIEFSALGQHVGQVDQRRRDVSLVRTKLRFFDAKRTPRDRKRLVGRGPPVDDQRPDQFVGGARHLQRVVTI